MKQRSFKLCRTLVFILIAPITILAKSNDWVVSLSIGQSITTFEKANKSNNLIPAGIKLGKIIKDSWEIGLEYCAFTNQHYEFESQLYAGAANTVLSQKTISSHIQYQTKWRKVRTFLKAGVGYSLINSQFTYPKMNIHKKNYLKNGLCYQIASGIFLVKGLFFEVNYNIVPTRSNIENSEFDKLRFDTLAYLFGYQISF